jgi:hypothetical protein
VLNLHAVWYRFHTQCIFSITLVRVESVCVWLKETKTITKKQEAKHDPGACTLGCLNKNFKFYFHGGSARLWNFKLLLNCRKKNQPNWIIFQTSKKSLKISTSFSLFIWKLSWLSWLWFFQWKKCVYQHKIASTEVKNEKNSKPT